jgi:HK97 family phage portal protein
MLWSWIKGLLGNYQGVQQTKPVTQIAEHTTPPTVSNILQIPAIWECVNKITKAMACLPMDVLRVVDEDGNTELVTDGYLHNLLNVSPNAFMTPADFLKKITLDYLIHGNAFVRIDKARGADYIAALIPLNPEQVTTELKGSKVIYKFWSDKNEIVEYSADQIMHWKGIGNGIVGLSTVDFARTTLTEAVAAQNASIEMFTTKGKLKGILCSETPLMRQDQASDFLKSFQAMSEAPIGIPLLPSGFKFQSVALSPVETQLLQTREFIVKEFARWFNIPYGLLTGESPELVDLSNYFYETTILPMCVEIEQLFRQKIVKDESLTVKFRTSVLKRMSDQTRIQMQTSYVQNGLRTRNEIRRDDGLKKLEGADELTAQNNLFPLSQLGQADETQTPQTPLNTQPVKQ